MTDPVSLTSEVYDQIVASYDGRSSQLPEHMLAFRAEFFGRVSGRAADLGCGPGRDLAAFTAMGMDIIGMDRSPGMLELAATRGRVVRGDLRRPPLRPGSLGGIWSSAALLHVPRPDVPSTLATWHAVLRSGGTLALSTSIGNDEGWELVPYATPKPVPEPLSRWFVHHPEDVLLSLIEGAGFTVDSVQRRTSHRDWLMVLATA